MDVTRHGHPRGIIAGFEGMVAAQAAWELCKAHDKPGVLPAIFWKADVLARHWQADRTRGGVKLIERGMRKAIAAGLIEENEDGDYIVHDYQQYQPDPTALARKRKQRAREYAELHDGVTDSHGPSRDVTADRSGHDGSGQEGDAPDYSKTHPPIPPDPVESPVDRSWIVREAFRNQYGEVYGYPAGWTEPTHTIKALKLVDRFAEVAKALGKDLTDELIEKTAKRATMNYLDDKAKFVTDSKHSFDVFVSRIDRYLVKA